MNNVEKFFCPVNGWDCPYYETSYEKEGLCQLGAQAIYECDDAAFYVEDEEEEE